MKKLITTAFLMTLVSVSYGQNPSPLPTSAFFPEAGPSTVKISPDGAHIAILAPEDGGDSTSLSIINVEELKVVFILSSRNDNIPVSFFWANNERIVYQSATNISSRNYPVFDGRLWAFNIDGSRNFLIAGNGAAYGVSHSLPNDQDHIRVERFDSLGSNRRRPPVSSFLLDINRNATISLRGRFLGGLSDEIRSPISNSTLILNDEGEVRLARGRNEDASYQIYERVGLDWIDITDDLVNNLGPIEPITIFGFHPRKPDVFYYTARGNSKTKGFFTYDLRTNKSELLISHPELDITRYRRNFANNEYIGATTAGNELYINHFSQHPDVPKFERLDATFPGELVEVVSSSTLGEKVILRVTGPKRPSSFFLLDTNSMELQLIYQSYSSLSPELMADVQRFAIRASDGLVLHGKVTMPKDTEGPLPTIVINQNITSRPRSSIIFDREAQYLAHHGFAVLQVNVRGSDGYGRDFTDAGIEQVGGLMIDDITQATRWAVQTGLADENNICLYGADFGAYWSIMSVIKEPNRYRCAAGLGGVYDLSTTYERSPAITRNLGVQATYDYFLGDDLEELQAQSPIYNANYIDVPLFLVAGANDRYRNVSQIEGMIDALEEAEVEFESWIVPNARNNLDNSEDRLKFYNDLLAFFKTNLSFSPSSQTTTNPEIDANVPLPTLRNDVNQDSTNNAQANDVPDSPENDLSTLNESSEPTSTSNSTRNENTTDSVVDDLNRLNELYEEGILNEEEFNAAKRRLLGL